MSTTMRVTGFTSGFDTDQMVKDMMKAESAKLDKAKQDLQYVQWQQESYRSFITQIQALQSKYFDVLSPTTNITSQASFSKYLYDITSGGVESKAVSISASAASASDKILIDEISQLATKDTWSGNASGMAGITSADFDLDALKTDLNNGDFQMTIAIGVNAKNIKITDAELDAISTEEEFADLLNDKIGDAFGDGYTNVASFDGTDLKLALPGSSIRVFQYGTNKTSLESLGFKSGQSSMDYTSKTLTELFGFSDSDLENFKINGISIDLKADDTYKEAMSKINTSAAGVTLSYDSLKDEFTLKSNGEGTASNIDIESGSSAEAFFSKIFDISDFTDPDLNREAGQNAFLKINGVDIVQSSNNFTIDGVAYTLNETSADPINVKMDLNTDEVVKNIKDFVTDYNALITSLTTALDETRDYDYKPLTDTQKEDMTEDEIKEWEKKAKMGMMGKSTELSAMVYKLRSVMMETVEGTGGLTLGAIGISTKKYTDSGKLTIDEDKLKTALETNYENVVKMFTQESNVDYMSEDTSKRYKENGLGMRLKDVLNDYARTTRDTRGNKGILLELAGKENDVTETDNSLSDRIEDYQDKIDSLEDLLEDREEQYYLRFSRMETALANMQAQYGSLMNMFGMDTASS